MLLKPDASRTELLSSKHTFPLTWLDKCLDCRVLGHCWYRLLELLVPSASITCSFPRLQYISMTLLRGYSSSTLMRKPFSHFNILWLGSQGQKVSLDRTLRISLVQEFLRLLLIHFI